ncbi:hypothetical protein ACH4UM_00980 [Streptomyces sp. NPDC020801]|uniref:hypothetical protein n=1 Tax=Streptomyces sp. NPDC020801 TaxID=3365093 RepID=UPI0037A794BB
MKNKLGSHVLAIPLALAILTGCNMTGKNSDDVPSAGMSSSRDVSQAMEKVSSGIYDLIGVKGKASSSRPFVAEYSGEGHKEIFPDLPLVEFLPDVGERPRRGDRTAQGGAAEARVDDRFIRAGHQ